MTDIEWLCELKCTACEAVVYAQVGNQKIPDDQIKDLKCCEKMDLKAIYTPIEDTKK